ncbi:glycosyltransferase family 2 protein [Mycolicibacterium litorale]|uniref:glycosyltransferase family 2 protein n=1 Tax=Mycolicibacterium litorale TaxID=758802 RepID=UPI001066A5A0|nr:glycosyltransferase family 2 protein [Mycolicibacterium litorale]MCV7414247.1 glycosyltransferase family 2 protein [Mycolicibacterium litorale]
MTSLRHPQNSGDYGRVERLLDDTLKSLLRQDHDDFGIWVVGNRRPAHLPDGVHYVEVGFPPPSAKAGPRTGRAAVLLDKGTKLVIGLLAARRAGASHVMFVDADDFVSRRLSGLVAGDPRANGWFVERGWRYNAERAAVRPQRRFHTRCGTAHIVRTDLFGELTDLHEESTQAQLQDTLGDRLERVFGSHLHIADDLARAGTPLRPIPFPAALYRLGTGENHSWNGMGGFGRPVTQAIAEEFGVQPTPRNVGAVVRAVSPGGAAVRHRVQRLRALAERA